MGRAARHAGRQRPGSACSSTACTSEPNVAPDRQVGHRRGHPERRGHRSLARPVGRRRDGVGAGGGLVVLRRRSRARCPRPPRCPDRPHRPPQPHRARRRRCRPRRGRRSAWRSARSTTCAARRCRPSARSDAPRAGTGAGLRGAGGGSPQRAASGTGPPRRGPAAEDPDDLVVTRHRGCARHHGIALRPAQQPVQRRGDGVLGRRPPAHHLRLRAGHRDVEQPQPLAGLLVGPAPHAARPSRRPRRRVARRRRGSGVRRRRGRAGAPAWARTGRRAPAGRPRGTAGPCWRGWSPAAPRPRRSRGGGCARRRGRRGPRRPARAARPAARPARGARAGAVSCSASPMWRRSVRRRSPPTSRSTRAGQPGRGRRLEHGRHAAAGDQVGPAAQHVGHLVGDVVAAAAPSAGVAVELGGAATDEAGQRGGAHPGAAVRLLEGLEQAQPLDGRRGGEDAAAAGDHRRHTLLDQRPLGGGQVGVAVGDDRDVAGLERRGPRRWRPRRAGGVRREPGRAPRGGAPGRPRARRPGRGPGSRGAPRAAATAPRPGRPRAVAAGGGRSTGCTTICSSPSSAPASSAWMASSRAASLRQLTPRVSVPVGAARRLRGTSSRRRRGRRRWPAWGRRSAPSWPPPLNARSSTCHCTGSVSWNSSTSTSRQRSCIRARAGESGASRARASWQQQVVVGQDRRGDACAGRARRAPPGRRRPAARPGWRRSASAGSRLACGSPTAAPGDRERLGVGEDRVAVGEGEGAQVEVVDDLAHQVVEVLHQTGPRVGVAGDAQRLQHQRAELVGGGDGGARRSPPAPRAPGGAAARGRRRRRTSRRSRSESAGTSGRRPAPARPPRAGCAPARAAPGWRRVRRSPPACRRAGPCPRRRSGSTRAPMVQVLPVPALASSSVVVPGAGRVGGADVGSSGALTAVPPSRRR